MLFYMSGVFDESSRGLYLVEWFLCVPLLLLVFSRSIQVYCLEDLWSGLLGYFSSEVGVKGFYHLFW